jgi:putative ABC transport system substrate-binding protein
VARVAVIYDPANPTTAGYLRTIEPLARSDGLPLSSYAVRNRLEIANAIDGFAAGSATSDGGMIVLPGPVGAANRDVLIALAARHRLPAVYAFRYHVVSGGLASYGVDNIDLYRRAAWYVDRILRGEKPAELPVQHASKFELVINLKTAKALGIEVPISLLARTDEVIE